MKLSNRILAQRPSAIRKFNKKALEIEKSGRKIYRLNIGQPDIETPRCFMDAVRGFDKKVLAYSESSGTEELHRAIADYYGYYGMHIAPGDMIITDGGSEALNIAFSCILDPGDELMIAEPFYSNYRSFAAAAGGRITTVATYAEEGYRYADMDRLEAAVTENTRAVCCVSPGNPTGYVLSLDEMKTICRFAQKHDLWVISDEVYREFTYDGRAVTSFGMLDEFADRIMIIDSVSKRFSACGARIGALICRNSELIENAEKIAQSRLSAPALDQLGAAELFKLPVSYFDDMRREYEGRRDAFLDEIADVPGIVCTKPGGAFYISLKLPVDDAENFLRFMLEEFSDNNETVMFTPEEDFYGTEGRGRNEIRVAYVLKQEEVRRSAVLLRLGLEAYRKKMEGNR